MRNKNIDIIRTCALLLVIIYHIWILTGSININNEFIKNIVSLGGEIGVTAFFVISGYGLYNLCEKLDRKDELNFIPFIKKRILRVAPEYYISIISLLFFTNMAVYMSKEGLDDIVLHILFLHNFSPETAGAISGVLWTMALTVQFYIVAPLLYKSVKNNATITALLAVGLTILSKFLFFHFWGKGIPNSNNFWLSRQILTSVIDNFVLGMYIAQIMSVRENKRTKNIIYLIVVLLSIGAMYYVLEFGIQNGIHTDNISGYIWHTVLAICIVIGMYNFAKIKFKDNIVSKFLLFISKHEYGIYVVHLIVIQNLLNNSPITHSIRRISIWVTIIWLLIVSLAVGVLFSLLCNCVRKYCVKDGK